MFSWSPHTKPPPVFYMINMLKKGFRNIWFHFLHMYKISFTSDTHILKDTYIFSEHLWLKLLKSHTIFFYFFKMPDPSNCREVKEQTIFQLPVQNESVLN